MNCESSSPEEDQQVAQIDDDDDGWSENECEAVLDSTLEKLSHSQEISPKQRHLINQKIARSNSHLRHRRASSESHRGKNSILGKSPNASDDWSAYKSCTSIRSQDSLNDIATTPKKSIERNFMQSNCSMVERMSDIYVNPPRRSIGVPTADDPSDKETSWHPLLSLVFGCLYVLYCISFFQTPPDSSEPPEEPVAKK